MSLMKVCRTKCQLDWEVCRSKAIGGTMLAVMVLTPVYFFIVFTRIECQNCGQLTPRDDLQKRLTDINPSWQDTHKEIEVLPDGDVNLTQDSIEDFKIVSCENCNGILKPQVVFFGDNVRRTIVESVFKKLQTADSMLVVGSSVQVYSAYRFVNSAWKNSKPIALINIGPTRVDDMAELKLKARCGYVLPRLQVIRNHSDLGTW